MPGGYQGDVAGGYAGYPQSGYPAYPGYPPPVIQARTFGLQGLSTALAVMLGLNAVTALLGIAFAPILIITFLLMAPIVIVFLIWFYRARQNAGRLDWRQRWSPGWAIGSWFVPICFLWFPYQIMADIWRAGLPADKRRQFAYLPAAWWACWCLAWFTGYRSSGTVYSGNTTGTTASNGRFIGVFFDGTKLSLMFGAAAAVLLALIVRQVWAGPVGNVGAAPAATGWQPGTTPGWYGGQPQPGQPQPGQAAAGDRTNQPPAAWPGQAAGRQPWPGEAPVQSPSAWPGENPAPPAWPGEAPPA